MKLLDKRSFFSLSYIALLNDVSRVDDYEKTYLSIKMCFILKINP